MIRSLAQPSACGRPRPARPCVRRLTALALGLVLGLALAPGSLIGQSTAPAAVDLGAAFDQAGRLHEQGRYTEAMAAYETLLSPGQVSSALHYNLGNACVKAGQLGRAILNYRLAQRLAPRDPDIQGNLRFARASVAGAAVPTVPRWRVWIARLTLNEWTLLACGSVWVLCLLLAWRYWCPITHRASARVLAPVAGATLAFGVGLALSWEARYGAVTAIVTAREAVLRHGPLEESPSVQTLPDGAELTVLDQKDGWLQVAGAPRGPGWLKRDQVVLLPP